MDNKNNNNWTHVPARNCKTVQIDADVAKRSLVASETIVFRHSIYVVYRNIKNSTPSSLSRKQWYGLLQGDMSKKKKKKR